MTGGRSGRRQPGRADQLTRTAELVSDYEKKSFRFGAERIRLSRPLAEGRPAGGGWRFDGKSAVGGVGCGEAIDSVETRLRFGLLQIFCSSSRLAVYVVFA